MGELHHECGVAAVFHAQGDSVSKLAPIAGDVNSVARLIPRMLLDMQNRGQLAAGMASFRADRKALIRTHKELGTVAEAFRLNHRDEFEAIMQGMDGPVAIGHVRYATCGGDDRYNAQPVRARSRPQDQVVRLRLQRPARQLPGAEGRAAVQGRLSPEARHRHRDHHALAGLRAADRGPAARLGGGVSAAGGEVRRGLQHRADHGLTESWSWPAIRWASARSASPSTAPLFGAASESVPLANLGFRNIRSLEPGTLAVANQDGVRIERYAPSPRQAHCFFEWIYFANVASTLDDRSVYLSRSELGKELARLETVPLDADTIVVPVPDTAKAAADAMAFALKIPSVEGLMRNRYVGRTFIEGTADRAAKARLKYTPLPEVLKGKRVLLVEDSIVRSTTMRALVHEIRDRGGAREIHLRVACPPIIAPCYYGIDMSSRDELFATRFVDLPDGGVSEEAQQKMARELGADSLRYLPVEAIARSVTFSPERLCRACITGQYPTETGQQLYQIAVEAASPASTRNGAGDRRAYERVAVR